MTRSISEYTKEHIFIGGEWVKPDAAEMFDSIDPATGRPWAKIAFGGATDVDRAVYAAERAFRGGWGEMAPLERGRILNRVADIYEQRAPELAQLESRDSGRPIRETRADLGAHAHWYRWYASLADKMGGRTIPHDSSVHAFTSRVPVGVVGAITPWNVPMLSTTWKVAPALAAGCTVVLKPAEHTSVTALELADIMVKAGVPPGVFNVVPGRGATVGDRLVRHPGVRKISFTGDGRTAKQILQAGAETMKRFTFELGGKAPHILFEDADIEQALNAATSSAWVACGQSCALGSRVLVQRSIYERVVAEFQRRAERVRVGLPLDEATHMGPQASIEQLEKTLRYIEKGRAEGARLVAGGERVVHDRFGDGYFVRPTVFADVSNQMEIARDEIFGPVASLIPFDDEEEAIAIANDTRYGLTAGLWTRDVGRAHRVAARIEAGMVWVNTYRFIRWSTPYGGFKESGWGREGGTEGMEPYLETRTTILSTTGQYPNPYEK